MKLIYFNFVAVFAILMVAVFCNAASPPMPHQTTTQYDVDASEESIEVFYSEPKLVAVAPKQNFYTIIGEQPVGGKPPKAKRVVVKKLPKGVELVVEVIGNEVHLKPRRTQHHQYPEANPQAAKEPAVVPKPLKPVKPVLIEEEHEESEQVPHK